MRIRKVGLTDRSGRADARGIKQKKRRGILLGMNLNIGTNQLPSGTCDSTLDSWGKRGFSRSCGGSSPAFVQSRKSYTGCTDAPNPAGESGRPFLGYLPHVVGHRIRIAVCSHGDSARRPAFSASWVLLGAHAATLRAKSTCMPQAVVLR